jgi:hypothetical protein
MFIGSPYNLMNKISNKPIPINNNPIPCRTDKYLCLGVNMDERLSWAKVLILSVQRLVPVLVQCDELRVKPFVPLPTLKMLYNAIVQTYFEYCSPLWDNFGIGLKDGLQKDQNRAARVITEETYVVRSADLLRNLNCLNGHTAPTLTPVF